MCTEVFSIFWFQVYFQTQFSRVNAIQFQFKNRHFPKTFDYRTYLWKICPRVWAASSLVSFFSACAKVLLLDSQKPLVISVGPCQANVCVCVCVCACVCVWLCVCVCVCVLLCVCVCVCVHSTNACRQKNEFWLSTHPTLCDPLHGIFRPIHPDLTFVIRPKPSRHLNYCSPRCVRKSTTTGNFRTLAYTSSPKVRTPSKSRFSPKRSWFSSKKHNFFFQS